MKKLFLFSIAALVCLSCGKEIIDLKTVEDSLATSIATRAESPEPLANNHFVTKEDVSKIVSKSFLKKEAQSISPVEEDGMTVMYVVSFDEGWALVAADDRAENQILAFDEEGRFDPDDIENPEFLFWYETTKRIMINLVKTKDTKNSPANEKEIKTRGLGDEEDYYWIRMHLRDDETQTEDHVNHLLNTKWGQTEPWNYKCPFKTPADTNSGRRLTGCVAVATAQILYYLKTTKNFSIGLYHGVSPTYYYSSLMYSNVPIFAKFLNISRTDYTPNSVRWAAMAKELDEDITTYVGDLMVDIGEHVDMQYGYSPGVGYESGTPNLVGGFPYYDVNYDSGSYTYTATKTALDNGYPVMVGAFRSNQGGGHAWVIDGYHDYSTTVDHVYMWYMASSDSLSYYQYDYCYTEAQKQQLIPDVNEGDIEHEYSYYSSKYLLMNWGWDGQNNNVKCWFSGSAWPSTNNNYTYNPTIVYNFRQEDE